MIEKLSKYWEEHPLKSVLFIAIFVLTIAVIFSKGFGMFDDHFLVIEASQSWVDGGDYNNWLPWNNSNSAPSGHSYFYVGIHFLLFTIMKFMGMTDPQHKMYIIRILHALLSLLTIIYGFKITYRLSNIKTARMVGLLLSVLWFFPFLYVRNLIEIVCIPFLMIAIWRIITEKDKVRTSVLRYWILTGFLLGIAINIRLQSVVFVFGVGLALLILKKWKETIYLSLGTILALVLFQSPVDYVFWGYPFAELAAYINHNILHTNDYIVAGWYNYLLLVLGIIIPPVGIFLFFGFFRMWRKHLIIFLPTFIFFVFHSYIPNKQERFIFPIIPFIIISGLIGWNEFKENSRFWNSHKKLLKACWMFFWIINLFLLPFITTTYSKRSRVEAMVYLSTQKNSKYFMMEDTNNDDITMPPLFYLKHWENPLLMTNRASNDSLIKWLNIIDYSRYPNYVLFCGDQNLQSRVNNFKTIFPKLSYLTLIDPGLIDKVICKMNPINKNQQIFIYKINHSSDDKKRINLEYSLSHTKTEINQ